MKPKVDKLIDKGEKIRSKIDEIITGYEYPSDNKSLIITAYYSVIIEHHSSIHLLIKNSLYGSAFALVRTIYEPFYKAHWIHAYATEEQIKKLIKGRDIFPEMKDIVRLIDKAYGTGNFFETIKNNSWSPMNDYTHSGIRQIARRFNKLEIVPNYELGEIVEVLNGTNTLILLFAIFILNVFNHKSEINEIEKLIKS